MGIFGEFSKPDVEAMEKKRDVEGLIKALKHEVKVVRWEAAEALGKIEDARALEPLTQALKDESEGVRKAVAEALEKIKSKKSTK